MVRWSSLLILVPFAVHGAATFHPVDDIARAAESALAAGPDTEVAAAVDPGLRLPACSAELAAVMQSATTAEVACPTEGWRLYVPLRVQRYESVYVLRRPVASGERIGGDMVAVERREVSRLPGGVIPANQPLDGLTARRALAPGSVLMSHDAQSPRVIRRGDPVVLVSRAGGIEVRANGKALGAAGVDERVSVENISSRRVVNGQVLPSGEVLVR
ncbi:flagellar basal body P-ring formation chaperone FlgA [Pseudomarimonas salicorniae]|uniref:Flagella basal body P-ring formation protein FlgA n=1 Tax=Pseudomarimonas salicorniae TaxID=2933270 RepID=A0ABT0GKX8_9GAMM|nr:flagellar basal body P-ring formation chaperone FlgA [Lysobacter sp. CAU 1642]MCK7595173.1 flagellar basal body P-ring formation protein FlgA [Lysobacter sp. CAU 1642]